MLYVQEEHQSEDNHIMSPRVFKSDVAICGLTTGIGVIPHHNTWHKQHHKMLKINLVRHLPRQQPFKGNFQRILP